MRVPKLQQCDSSQVSSFRAVVCVSCAQRSDSHIDELHSILSFQRRALLDDFATLGQLRLPRFGRLKLIF